MQAGSAYSGCSHYGDAGDLAAGVHMHIICIYIPHAYAYHMQVTLLLVDRFSGGAVAALSQQAGVAHRSTSRDASLLRFERHCANLGLTVQVGVAVHVHAHVPSSQNTRTLVPHCC